MNTFNMRPPLPPNPSGGIWEQQKEMAAALGDLTAELAAMRGVLLALVASHPTPTFLVEAYLLHMDSLAETVRPERIEKYRQAAQQWRDVLLASAHR